MTTNYLRVDRKNLDHPGLLVMVLHGNRDFKDQKIRTTPELGPLPFEIKSKTEEPNIIVSVDFEDENFSAPGILLPWDTNKLQMELPVKFLMNSSDEPRKISLFLLLFLITVKNLVSTSFLLLLFL